MMTAIERKVDPSLMPRRAVLGWNFKQQHLVDRKTVVPFFARYGPNFARWVARRLVKGFSWARGH